MKARIAILVLAATAAVTLAGEEGEFSGDTVRREAPHTSAVGAPSAPVSMYEMNWISVNSGGDVRLPGTTYDLGLTAGESVSGFVAGTQFDMGFGFWYGSGLCPIALSGDVNLNGSLGTSDIITMVNFTLKGGPDPRPCVANGDSNCDGIVSLSDIVVLINRVLKGGPDPCDACTVIPSLRSCP